MACTIWYPVVYNIILMSARDKSLANSLTIVVPVQIQATGQFQGIPQPPPPSQKCPWICYIVHTSVRGWKMCRNAYVHITAIAKLSPEPLLKNVYVSS